LTAFGRVAFNSSRFTTISHRRVGAWG
jgi:hypothetical protein